MQDSLIHRTNPVGFLLRDNGGALPSFLHMPGSSLNSENLKGHILLQERTCYGLIIFTTLLDGPNKNCMKPNLSHPIKRDYQWSAVAHIFDPNTWEAEVGLWIQGQPNLYSETFCLKIMKQPTETGCGGAHLGSPVIMRLKQEDCFKFEVSPGCIVFQGEPGTYSKILSELPKLPKRAQRDIACS